jgi:alternate F1F0 ATPase F1 subunit gamma
VIRCDGAITTRLEVIASWEDDAEGFNGVVADHALKTLAALPGNPQVRAVGERVHACLADAGLPLVGLFTVPNSVKAITPLVGQILVESEAHHREREVTELHLFYNRPTSGAVYAPVSQRLLPMDENWRRKLAERPWPTGNLPEVMGGGTAALRALIREYLFVSLFRACAESLASENASRLAAMERADRNIGEVLENLHGRFQRVRQSSIDEELFDVISGFEALVGPRQKPKERHVRGYKEALFSRIRSGACVHAGRRRRRVAVTEQMAEMMTGGAMSPGQQKRMGRADGPDGRLDGQHARNDGRHGRGALGPGDVGADVGDDGAQG